MYGMQPVTMVTISGAFVFGMVLALLGSLKLALAKRLALGEARIGGLLSALNLALIPMMLASGVLIDLWSVRIVLLVGSLVTALSLGSLSLRLTYMRTLLAILLVGVGTAAISTASMVLMPTAFADRSETAAVNLGCVFIALGALITPALVDILVRLIDFRRAVLFLAVVCLVPAVLIAFTPTEQFQLKGEHADLNALLHSPALWMAGLVFFLYAPLEGAIGIWATSYLTEIGCTERRSVWTLSGFWAAFLASRLLIAVVPMSNNWTPWLLVVPAMLTAVLLGNLLSMVYQSQASWTLLMLGFVMGPIFPTLVGVIFRTFGDEKGTAYGAIFAIGSIGSLFLAPLIGARARQRSVQTAFRIPMVIALLLTLASLVFVLTMDLKKS
jgi:fucose permease